jgi:hypothetical protein
MGKQLAHRRTRSSVLSKLRLHKNQSNGIKIYGYRTHSVKISFPSKPHAKTPGYSRFLDDGRSLSTVDCDNGVNES